MKSIGNGWKRAQEARTKAEKDSRNRSYAEQGIQISSPLRDLLARPSIHQGLCEGIGYVQMGDGKTKPQTLWQRIKRAMRAL